MAPPEYPKIVVTPSSANTCTIISAPVIFWPASGCWMEGAEGEPVAVKSRILGVFAIASGSLAVCRPASNRYPRRRADTAPDPTEDASYHRHPPAERGRRAHPRHRAFLDAWLQHRVAVGGGHG